MSKEDLKEKIILTIEEIQELKKKRDQLTEAGESVGDISAEIHQRMQKLMEMTLLKLKIS